MLEAAGMVQRFSWIEASLRFGGYLGAAEKKAYRDPFDLTDFARKSGQKAPRSDPFLGSCSVRVGVDSGCRGRPKFDRTGRRLAGANRNFRVRWPETKSSHPSASWAMMEFRHLDRVRFKVVRCRIELIGFGTEQTNGGHGYDR